jgi:hypothetical protein
MLDTIRDMDQQVLFIAFVSVMILMAIVIFIFNERNIRHKARLREAELEVSRKRLEAYGIADKQHMSHIETLFHIHRLASDAIRNHKENPDADKK